MTGETDIDIPEKGAIFTFGKSNFADNVQSKFWLKNDHAVKIACGEDHTAVITDKGRLLMLGCNDWGQLGLGQQRAAFTPTFVKASKSERVKLVACGRDHTIICTWCGSVYVTGRNQKGQLGLGHRDDTTLFQLMPPFCDHAPIKMLSAGCSTSAALTEDGRVFVWGDNSVGQIGLGAERFALEPSELSVGPPVIWVSCGGHHSALVTANGDLYTFGESANGRLGLYPEQLTNHREPQRVLAIPEPVIQVSCGGEHTVVLAEEEVYTFGRGQYGQLGQGTFLFAADLPKALQLFHHGGVCQVTCGQAHTALITNNGLLYTFGDGRHGRLGLGEEDFINQFHPTLCTRFLQFSVHQVTCGGNHMLVLATTRPPDCEVVEMAKEAGVGDYHLELNYKELLLQDLDLPIFSRSARARRRDRIAAKKPHYLRLTRPNTDLPGRQSPPPSPAKIPRRHKQSATDYINARQTEEENRCVRELPSPPLMVGVAGVAAGLLGAAVTSVSAFQSDSDTATSPPSSSRPVRAESFIKQRAVVQESLSSTHSSLRSDPNSADEPEAEGIRNQEKEDDGIVEKGTLVEHLGGSKAEERSESSLFESECSQLKGTEASGGETREETENVGEDRERVWEGEEESSREEAESDSSTEGDDGDEDAEEKREERAAAQERSDTGGSVDSEEEDGERSGAEQSREGDQSGGRSDDKGTDISPDEEEGEAKEGEPQSTRGSREPGGVGQGEEREVEGERGSESSERGEESSVSLEEGTETDSGGEAESKSKISGEEEEDTRAGDEAGAPLQSSVPL
ncbi:X-linked retinitis pigmentosa GTPase regulator-like [Gadus chalcogrammus]|uniref:X-linked retinitis pigmentosa GTPase regulator-like n=1 Tax=Gadus chalcogrammus TaxID=1042646 RepID=UPI0024C4977D|nr:X-linked retinitis pigmentosa GTPase regulator-like [Gadus chalcogrammus]